MRDERPIEVESCSECDREAVIILDDGRAVCAGHGLATLDNRRRKEAA